MSDCVTNLESYSHILRAENETLRAALAERQAAIDELVASSRACAECPDDDSDALSRAGRRYADAWKPIRALATKEPQP